MSEDGPIKPDDEAERDFFSWKVTIVLGAVCGLIATGLLVIGWYVGQLIAG